MAEELGHGVHSEPGRQQRRRVGVAQVVEFGERLGEAGATDGALERVPWPAVGRKGLPLSSANTKAPSAGREVASR